MRDAVRAEIRSLLLVRPIPWPGAAVLLSCWSIGSFSGSASFALPMTTFFSPFSRRGAPRPEASGRIAAPAFHNVCFPG
jgi:hypothetical protein